MSGNPKRCDAEVRIRGLSFPRYRTCMKWAIDGEEYCAIHDPKAKARRDEKRLNKFRNKMRQWNLQNAAPDGYELAKLVVDNAHMSGHDLKAMQALARKIIKTVEGE